MIEEVLFPQIEIDPSLISDNALEDLGSILDKDEIKRYIDKEKKEARNDEIWKWARGNFKNEDETPWEMSPGELAIYKTVLFRKHPRVEIVSSTQYGKTLTVSRALLTRVCAYAGDWMLVVPDMKRGRIIINYMIRDTANNQYFSNKLAGINLSESNVLLMRLLEEKSKVKLTYQVMEQDGIPRYGTVEIITADARRKQNAISSIMGFGGRNIIQEEASLVDDDVDSGIFRMMAGKGEDTFLVKIGNPFFRNHFLTTWKDKRYKKIFINNAIGLAEGRYNEEFLEEAMKKPNAEVLYDCKFPKSGSIDQSGWMQLLTDEEIKLAMTPGPHFGEEREGCDPSDEGTDQSVIVKRSQGFAEILYQEEGGDAMQFAGPVVLNSEIINSKKIYIDRVGVGAATFHKVVEMNRVTYQNKLKVTGVNAGETTNDKQFFNKRAEMYWRTRQWIKSGGRLSKSNAWYELTKIKYQANEKGQVKIMSKKDMRSLGIPSPNVADSLSMTFYQPPTAIAMTEDEKFFLKKMSKNKENKGSGYNLRPIGR